MRCPVGCITTYFCNIYFIAIVQQCRASIVKMTGVVSFVSSWPCWRTSKHKGTTPRRVAVPPTSCYREVKLTVYFFLQKYFSRTILIVFFFSVIFVSVFENWVLNILGVSSHNFALEFHKSRWLTLNIWIQVNSLALNSDISNYKLHQTAWASLWKKLCTVYIANIELSSMSIHFFIAFKLNISRFEWISYKI